MKVKIEKQEEELQGYARATGLVITAEKNDAQEAELVDLQKELSAARADRTNWPISGSVTTSRGTAFANAMTASPNWAVRSSKL